MKCILPVTQDVVSCEVINYLLVDNRLKDDTKEADGDANAMRMNAQQHS